MRNRIGAVGLAVMAGTTLMAVQALPAVAQADVPDEAQGGVLETQGLKTISDQCVSLSTVEGIFSFNQDQLSSIEEIRLALGTVPEYLCGPQGVEAAPQQLGQASVTNILVSGNVDQQIAVDLTDTKQNKITVVMGCSCAGNLAGGRGTANAEITGVKVTDLMEQAGAAEDVNTVVFTSADGYEVAMPLSYVTQRHSVIVTEVNGEPIGESVGSSNQLWLGSTSARYFAKDITNVAFEQRQTPPPNPYTDEGDEYYGNFPGVGVSSAEV
ncbi:Oxidoreductase molybdopterin binding domain [Slackia heliotrinireducens]|uniref:Sulfite oxidase-like oxidoreductase n=1 Tax=Slackia heliotrinireducens (strain ATCC 29202 / DSM 20476 / NCTC 11029 / RHS 1) TaxID=471855 RepID=C7N712_SLAHD|nr:molybdopterin-dependent oxidoreductase [Slackia heliotrinireducens]ACV22697.1 sulfite oxidase-like oxidoreductase [Slackia heliotrinireducens DSM 20476]VEH01300.1 Oxidoreductase molybdopterin binding domain [Slackia heliotrinireducens]